MSDHVRDPLGRLFPWRHRAELARLEGRGPSGWLNVYPAYTGAIFDDGATDPGSYVVAIVGPRHPGRDQLVERYRLRGALAEVKAKVRDALDRRQRAWDAHDRPLVNGS